jgi:hypothetical protein
LLKRLGRRRRRRKKGKGTDRKREWVVLTGEDAAEGVAGVLVVCEAKRSRARSARGLRKKREGARTEAARGGGKDAGRRSCSRRRRRRRLEAGVELGAGAARGQLSGPRGRGNRITPDVERYRLRCDFYWPYSLPS